MKRGFTLIELLIYIGIFAIVAGLLTGVLTTSLKVNQKESTADETTSQVNFVLQTIQGLVRESSAIIVNSSSTNIATDYNIGTSSTIGSPQSRLVLRMHDSLESSSTARDPIIITIASSADQYGNPINSIVMYQGNNGYQGNNYQTSSTLTNARVTVDQLQFTKYTQYPGHDTVTIDMQISYNINSPAKTTRNIHSAISRVSAATFDSSVLPGSAYTYSLGQNGSPWQNIYMSPGSAANPSYTFTGNPNLGIFAVSNTTQLGFSTAGIQRMVIDQNGNVGIGNTNPTFPLDVNGYIFSHSNGTYGNIGMYDYSNTNWNSPFWESFRARGTSVTPLAVSNGDNIGVLDYWGHDGTQLVRTGQILVSVAGPVSTNIIPSSISFINTNAAGLLKTNMYIDPSGNVGIGTITPQAILDVNGAANINGAINIVGSINKTTTNLPLFRWLPQGIMTTYSGTGAGPEGIAFDGTNMWTTNFSGNSVTKITPSGAMTTYTGINGPNGIAFDGTNMWTANSGSNSVTKITPSGAMTNYSGISGVPNGIAFDGTNMWTSNYSGNSVTKITPSGATTTYSGTGASPYLISFDGTNMWTANYNGNSVTKITSTGSMTTYSGTGANPNGIAFDGINMWTANGGSNSVTKITPSGAMTTYTGTGAWPYGIAFDGTNMWTTNYNANSVTKITPSGTMTTYSGTGASPYLISFDGTNMWTANFSGNSVTKILVNTK